MEMPDQIFDTDDDDSNVDESESRTSFDRANKLVPGGLAADSEHSTLASSYPTPPTHETQQHTLSPGMDFTDDRASSLAIYSDSSLNIKVSE